MTLPKELPETPQKPDSVLSEIRNLQRDNDLFEKGRVFYSMCSKPEPAVVEAHKLFIEANLGDPNCTLGRPR